MKETILTIELVPRPCWCSNVRSEVPRPVWDRIRRQAYDAAGHACEICGGVGKKWPVECHEKWQYDDKEHIQLLTGMTALCPACHEVKHIGRAGAIGRREEARNHLMKVNEWTAEDADIYIEVQFEIWGRRSTKEWSLDMSILSEYGVKEEDLKQGFLVETR